MREAADPGRCAILAARSERTIWMPHAAGPHRAPLPATISSCARAILRYHAVDPISLAGLAATDWPIRVSDIAAKAGHLTMTMRLPMPIGSGEMTIETGARPRVTMPGVAFSPAIAAAAIGRPLARLTGQRALDAVPHIVIGRMEEVRDAAGGSATVLHFTDRAEPLRPADDH